MTEDPIVKEVRKTREKILESFDFDTKKYIEYLKEKQKENKENLITKPFKKEFVNVN